MNVNSLLPAKFKKWRWLILIPTPILGIITIVYEWEPEFLDVTVPALFIDEFLSKEAIVGMTTNNILNELYAIFVIIRGFLVAFSKEEN